MNSRFQPNLRLHKSLDIWTEIQSVNCIQKPLNTTYHQTKAGCRQYLSEGWRGKRESVASNFDTPLAIPIMGFLRGLNIPDYFYVYMRLLILISSTKLNVTPSFKPCKLKTDLYSYKIWLIIINCSGFWVIEVNQCFTFSQFL